MSKNNSNIRLNIVKQNKWPNSVFKCNISDFKDLVLEQHRKRCWHSILTKTLLYLNDEILKKKILWSLLKET